MLTSLQVLKAIPELSRKTDAQLTVLLNGASATIKKYCKQNIELATYTNEFYSGNGKNDLALRQRPVNSVTSLYVDQYGYYNTTSNAFASTTLWTEGNQFVLRRDGPNGTASESGLLVRIGGDTNIWIAGIWTQEALWQGKLAASRLPTWPVGEGNIKVTYSAGYALDEIPDDIITAVITLTAWFIRTVPTVAPLQSENLGSYSYTLMMRGLGQAPELGSLRQLLSRYREWSI